ncbi:MAG: hypothetical protein K2Y51_19500 [Gammaproteobacteria bacterium]|nr:hypothetical protein [Gammaproteobacteria bacterium]
MTVKLRGQAISTAVPREEQPDAEVQAFGCCGVEILVEFWTATVRRH